MKTIVVLFAMILSGAQVQAASKFAGDYFTILKSYFPTTPAGRLAGAINITIGSNGLISGKGVFVDRTPLSVTGRVNDAGKVVLDEGSAEYVGYFNPGGRDFFIAFPETTITGLKLARKFPEAGVYHAKTGSKEKLILYVYRDHAVYGTIYRPDHTLTAVEGTATAEGFAVESMAGGIFKGKFDGTVISGTFTTPAGGTGTLTGAKY